MRMALDIDGVLLDTMTPYLKIFNYEYGDNKTLEDLTDFEFGPILGLERKEMYEIFERIETKNMYLMDSSIPSSINKLKDCGYTVDLLTATSGNTFTKKCVRLNELGVKFDNAFKVEDLKGDFAKVYEFIVDDSPAQLEDILKHGGRPICFDQPWNQQWKGERIHRFYNIWRL